MEINRKWHKAHRMPKNATVQQKIRWHLGHQKHCGCREMPKALINEMKKRGMK
jgi:hypothetical protein